MFRNVVRPKTTGQIFNLLSSLSRSYSASSTRSPDPEGVPAYQIASTYSQLQNTKWSIKSLRNHALDLSEDKDFRNNLQTRENIANLIIRKEEEAAQLATKLETLETTYPSFKRK